MRYLSICAVLVLIIAMMGCTGNSVPKPYGAQDHFKSDPIPQKVKIEGNPLDYAGARLGIDVRNFELPRAFEGAYRLSSRFPLIDYISNQPLYMKQWLEDTAPAVFERQQGGIKETLAYMLAELRGTAEIEGDFSAVPAPSSEDIKRPLALSYLSNKFQADLSNFYADFKFACDLSDLAILELTDDDIEFFSKNPGYYLAPDGKSIAPLTGDISAQDDFVARARKVSFFYLFASSYYLASAVDEFVSKLKSYKKDEFYSFPSGGKRRFTIATIYGTLVVSGFSDDLHETDAAILIDLGGNDTYTNNAGGISKPGVGASVCIDLSGNDTYKSEGSYVQGCGFMGTGILVDAAGNDSYMAKHFSQGAGILGVGMLVDEHGEDKYCAQTFVQGAGMFGLGMLLDSAGEDYYDGASLCQGGATTLGIGLLSDLSGDDRYHLSIGPGKDAMGSAGYGQGGALSFRHYPWRKKLTRYGGAGLLFDRSGNDRYRTRGWCSQGGSYIMSLGALYDESGNDHYTSNTGQGSGIHVTNAILIDRHGNDIYDGSFRTGAAGGDRSPGILIDYEGNDIYKSGKAGYGNGCKPLSYSLFIDYKGNDQYITSHPADRILFNDWDSFGGVWPESVPYLWPYAMCFDLGGDDNYQVRNRANNTERHSFGHGIHLDTNWEGTDIIGEVKRPHEDVSKVVLPKEVLDSIYEPLISRLTSEDTFERFSAIGQICEKGPEILEYLVAAVANSTNTQFNRDVMECINSFFISERIGAVETIHIIELLNSPDKEVAAVIADNFGIWGLPGVERALLSTLSSQIPEARKYALVSLLARKSEKGLEACRSLALADPSSDVRRIAAVYLGRLLAPEAIAGIMKQVIASEKDSGVRCAALRALANVSENEIAETAEWVFELSDTFDYYQKRACGSTLAELGDIRGVDILIDSLSFPSIDAFYNYARNVPNSIAKYCDHDLTEKERYDQGSWRKWFDENMTRIDLKRNVKYLKEYENLKEWGTDSPEKLNALIAFADSATGYKYARKDLAVILNSHAWNMVSAPKASKDNDPILGLKYAQKAVEYDQQANYYDTLAQAYEAVGNIERAREVCEDALKRFQGNKIFSARLEKYNQGK